MLGDLQRMLRDSILAGTGVPPTAGIISGKLSRDAQLGIHRVNTIASLIGVLQAAYPAICSLVGKDHFNHAAAAYVRKHPPRRPHLSTYGWRFAKFLCEFEPARALTYLPDLARLEWARNVAYFAADTAPLDVRTLSSQAGNRGDLTFDLHPATRLVAAPFPIHRIWCAAQDANATFDPDAGAEHVIVTRPGLRVVSEVLSPGDFTLLLALDAGASLEQAASAAVAIEPEFDLQRALFGHFERGAFRAPTPIKPNTSHEEISR